MKNQECLVHWVYSVSTRGTRKYGTQGICYRNQEVRYSRYMLPQSGSRVLKVYVTAIRKYGTQGICYRNQEPVVFSTPGIIYIGNHILVVSLDRSVKEGS